MTKAVQQPRWYPKPKHEGPELRHGARSPRVYQPLADELAAELFAERPDLAPCTYEVRSWSIAETRAELLRLHLDDVSLIGEGGERKEQVKCLRG